jgi:filamentous hemagglutinin
MECDKSFFQNVKIMKILLSFLFIVSHLLASIPDLHATDTLTYSSLSDTMFSNSHSFGGGTNIGFSETYTEDANGNKNTNTNSKVNSSSLNFGTDMSYSSSKVLATLGQGSIIVKDKDNSDDINSLNRDTNSQINKLYEGSVGTSVEASIDHRLLSEEGRKSIKEDFYKSGNLIGAVRDVITEKSIDAVDFFDHVVNLEINYAVSKEFAQLDKGKYAKMMNDIDKLSDTQLQEVIEVYAEVYAHQHGISIQDALVTVLNDTVKKGDTTYEKPKGAHVKNDDGSSSITIDAKHNQNTLDYAGSIIHEGTHASVYQQESTYTSEGMNTENYANLLGKYAQGDFSFVYSNLGYGTVNTNTIKNDFSTSQIFQDNTNWLMGKIENEPEKVEFSTEARKIADNLYKITDVNLKDDDKGIYVVDENKIRTGEKLGETLWIDSFYYSDVSDFYGVIDTASTEGTDFLYNVYFDTPSVPYYILTYAPGLENAYDFKKLPMPEDWATSMKWEKEKTRQTNWQYRGVQIASDVYASGRDIGNIAAGYVAGYNGQTWEASKSAFETLQAIKSKSFDGTEASQTVQNERYGWEMGGWYKRLEQDAKGAFPLSNELFINNTPERENAIDAQNIINNAKEHTIEQMFYLPW